MGQLTLFTKVRSQSPEVKQSPDHKHSFIKSITVKVRLIPYGYDLMRKRVCACDYGEVYRIDRGIR